MALEGIGWMLVSDDANLAKVRHGLLGNNIFNNFQNTTSQAYLNYIPTPNLIDKGFRQHNAQGFRGDSVPLGRISGRQRILFLGGSVVYGWGVANPGESYPAQCGRLLGEQEEFRGIEIINGGAPWLTTAEMINHYLLKYRYFHPDLVVINEGGNDAEAIDHFPHYQPDYSHWRKPMTAVRPLPPHARWMLHSRLVSWFIIQLFYSDLLHQEMFVHQDEVTPTHWFPERTLSTLAPSEDAYRNNLGTLVREIRHDGAEVLLVEWSANPHDTTLTAFWPYYRHAALTMQEVAQETGVPFVPFPHTMLSSREWFDDCHLTAEGERIKATYLLPWIKKALLSKASSPNLARP
jgi:lysophospholipase L1-like esterase